MGKPRPRSDWGVDEHQLQIDSGNPRIPVNSCHSENQYRPNQAEDMLSGFLNTLCLFSNIISLPTKGKEELYGNMSKENHTQNKKQMQAIQDNQGADLITVGIPPPWTTKRTSNTNTEEGKTTGLPILGDCKTTGLASWTTTPANRDNHRSPSIPSGHDEYRTTELVNHGNASEIWSSPTPINAECSVASDNLLKNEYYSRNRLNRESKKLNGVSAKSKRPKLYQFDLKGEGRKIKTVWRQMQGSRHFKLFTQASTILSTLLSPNSKSEKVSSLKSLKENDVLMSIFLYQRRKLGKLRIPILRSPSHTRVHTKCKVTRNKTEKGSAKEAKYVGCSSPTYENNCVNEFKHSPIFTHTEEQSSSSYTLDVLKGTDLTATPWETNQRTGICRQENSEIQKYYMDYGRDGIESYDSNSQQEQGPMTSIRGDIPSCTHQTKTENSPSKPFLLYQNSVTNMPSYYHEVNGNLAFNGYMGNGKSTGVTSSTNTLWNIDTASLETADVKNSAQNVSYFQYSGHDQLCKGNENRSEYENSNNLINNHTDFHIDYSAQNSYSSMLNDEYQNYLNTF